MPQTIALGARYTPVDLAGIESAAQGARAKDISLRDAEMMSQLNGRKVSDQMREMDAMDRFRNDLEGGNRDNAIRQLDAYPEMQSKLDEIMSQTPPGERKKALDRMKAFSAAAKFVHSFPDGSEQQRAAWNNTLASLLRQGHIDQEHYDMAMKSGPNRMLINEAMSNDDFIKRWSDPRIESALQLNQARIDDIGADNERAAARDSVLERQGDERNRIAKDRKPAGGSKSGTNGMTSYQRERLLTDLEKQLAEANGYGDDEGAKRIQARIDRISASGTQGGAPPPAAIRYLIQNPDMRDAFEEKYGVSADDYLGE